MYPTSAVFQAALRGAPAMYSYVEAWRAGARLTFNGDTRLPLTGGSVTVDGGTPGVRRTLSASFAADPGLFDFLAPSGTELRAYTVMPFVNGSTSETVPLGVFDIDVQRMGYAASGDISITAPDRWVRVQRARFLKPRAATYGLSVRNQIAQLLLEALPAGTAITDTGTSTVNTPAQTWDEDRAGAITDLAKAANLDVFFDRNGLPVIRDIPVLTTNPAWIVDASASGVMVSADRERNRQKTANVVGVRSEKVDDQPLFDTVFVWDADPNSATYAGPDPINNPGAAGPFGVRPTFYSSPLITNQSQADAVARTILARVTALAAQLTLESITNPALDDGDTILVQLPQERRDIPRPIEMHLVDKLTVPLVLTKSPMQIETRSTRADDLT